MRVGAVGGRVSRGRLLRCACAMPCAGVELVSSLCAILKSDLSFWASLLHSNDQKQQITYLFHCQFFEEQRKRLVQAIVPNLVPNVLLQEYRLSYWFYCSFFLFLYICSLIKKQQRAKKYQNVLLLLSAPFFLGQEWLCAGACSIKEQWNKTQKIV